MRRSYGQRMAPTPRSVKRAVVGRRMPLRALEGELLPRWMALPIFASDPLSSVAYATEAALVVLVGVSVGSRGDVIPISFVIAALLVVVVLSYRQTIFAYPNGGGSYVVSKENLGATAGLVAAAALLTDYVLTAAVSIASGVLAITSAVPSLASHAVALSLGMLVVLLLVNLRGVRESGFAFALPTYAFILSMFALVAIGLVKGLLTGWPQAHAPSALPVGTASGLGLIVLLRAFASGCSALTGVEAISNGVTAFRRPQARNAASTLGWMAGIAVTLFVGVSILAWQTDARPSGSVSVLSEVARAVFPSGSPSSAGYYLVQATTAAVLILAANTAYQGFPRLTAILAGDSYLPRQFSNLGDRLVFSNGIVILTGLAAALIVGFDANVNSLIQLYLLGVFTAFTLSQFGMVRHNHERLRLPGAKRGQLRWAMVINTVGGLLTGLVGAIVIATKFNEGGWMVTVAIPLLVVTFAIVGRHYAHVRTLLREPADAVPASVPLRGPVVLYVPALDDSVAHALRYVRAIAGEQFHAIHVADGGTSRISGAWRAFSDAVPPLVVLPRDGTISGTVASYVRDLERAPGEVVTVVIPELFSRRSLLMLLRGRTALALKLRLHDERDVAVTDIPVVADSSRLASVHGRPPQLTAIVPMADLNMASRRAVRYAVGLGASRVHGLHVALGADDGEEVAARLDTRGLPFDLRVVASPYRDLGTPLVEEVRRVTEASPDALCAVVLPEIISTHRWQRLLHNQRALFIKRLLLFEERVVLTSVPINLAYVDEAEAAPADGLARVDVGTGIAVPVRPGEGRRTPAPALPTSARPARPRISTEALWRAFEGVAGSVALLGVLVAGLLAVRGRVAPETVGIALMLPPLVAAISGRALSISMALLSGLVLNYFFIKPYYTFAIDSSEGVTAFVVYVIVATVVAGVAGRLRVSQAEAERRLRERDLIAEIALDRLAGVDVGTALQGRLTRLADLLEAEIAVEAGGSVLASDGALPALAHAGEGVRYAVGRAGTARVVVDAGRRATRDHQHAADALARVLAPAAGAPAAAEAEAPPVI
jgi:amino acid transporter